MARALLTYTQLMQGRWAHGQEIHRGCGLVEEGIGPISGFQPRSLLEDTLLGWHRYPK